ncbi:MAG: hypothetical protein ABSE53_03105 [Terracidiphilus sp.]|jgi:hypothetical protein
MKRAFCVIVLAAAVAVCSSQYPQPSVGPDLGKFTSDQLRSCYHNSSICGTRDEEAIRNELAKRLPQFSEHELLECFRDSMICGSDEFAIAEELNHRGHTSDLMNVYWREPSTSIREGILLTLTRSHRAGVKDFMQKALAARRGGEEELVWAAAYLAPTCDPDALQWLSERKDRPLGCLFWPDVVSAFGKCNYRKAVPYIVDYSIRDACLNIDDEGVKDLQRFFPHSPKQFTGMEAMQDYYCTRARKEGFNVDCSPK